MTDEIKVRIPPLPREEWTDASREVCAYWGEPNAWEEGSKTNVINVMSSHPPLGAVYNQWGKHLLMHNTVPVRYLEILILRVAVRVKSAYEWHNHVGYGMNAGLTLEEIGALRDAPDSYPWPELERAIIDATDELIDNGIIGDETWATLSKHFDRSQLMDLTFSIGHYVMTSWALSTFGVQLESPDPIGFDLRTKSGKIPGKTYKPGETEDWIDTRGY